MTTRIGGSRSKTRKTLSKHYRNRGKVSLRKYLQKLNVGDSVTLKAEPAVQKGLYFPRFHGKIGVVTKKRGFCYEVMLKDFNKQKTFIVHPVHLKKVSK